ncbi:OmpA/MotB domain-containing protein [Cylindrospermum sp. NIES-4074]|nr:OmpA/MotB domain-containing protein [Cylindrospermum sp. NIES-4074]
MAYERVKRNNSSNSPAPQQARENQFSPHSFYSQPEQDTDLPSARPTYSREPIGANSPPPFSAPNTLQTKPAPEIQESELESEEQESKLEQGTLALQGEGEPENPTDENPDLSSNGVIQRLCSKCDSEGEKDTEQKTPLQTKLTIGSPGDKYEQEANSMASQVMSMDVPTANPQPTGNQNEKPLDSIQKKPLAQTISPLIQQQAKLRHNQTQTQPVTTISPLIQQQAKLRHNQTQTQQITSISPLIQQQAKLRHNQTQTKPVTTISPLIQRIVKGAEPKKPTPENPSLESRLASEKGSGSPLDEQTRSFMEPRFGADFSSVRVHTDSTTVQMNKELGAQAFTHGSDIFYGAGKAPGKNELTAHELTHVVQQTGVVQPKTILEQQKQTTTEELTNSTNAEIGIQRACSECEAEQEEKKHTGTIQAKAETSGFNRNLFKPSLLNKSIHTPQAKTIEEQSPKALLNNNQNEFSLTKQAPTALPAKEISPQNPQLQTDLESPKTGGSNAVQRAQLQTNNPLIQKQSKDPRPQGKSVGKSGVAFYEAGLELYNQPSKAHGSTIIRKIPIGTKLFIDKELSGGWYHIALSSGEYGYVDATKVNTRLPDPGAQLYKVQDGQKVIGIAERYYKQFVQPGRDLRFYVNVLEEVNRQGGGIYRPLNTSWKDTQAKAGIHIWIPSAAFANTFDGKLSSGSSVRDALKQAGNVAKTVGGFAVGGASFIAGQLHGALESVWSNLTGIKDLAVMVWDILKSMFTGNLFNDGAKLWNSLTQTNWGDLAQAWLGDFNKKWNNPDLMQKWHFRGWVLGYAAAEIAIAILTAGGATGAKWAGKMSTKAIEVIKKIPGVAKLAEKVKTIKIPAVVKQRLKNANTAKLLNKHRNNIIKKYGADGVKMLSEGVIAKRVTQKGHTLKVLANGKIVRCSTCEELAKQFAKELNENKKLSHWLKNLQKRATENPEGVADEIKLIENELEKISQTKPKAATEVVSSTTKPKQVNGYLPEDIKAMMKSQKIAPDIVNKGVHFNVDQVELKLVPSGNTFELKPVFSSYKKEAVDAAIRRGKPVLDNPAFQKWLLKHAKAGLEMAQQAKNAERVEYFKEVIKIIEGRQ